MSAGYFFYSLDSQKFQKFVEQPAPAQLAVIAEFLKEGLEEYEDEIDEDDPVLKWPKSKKALATAAAQRLAQPDWYSDLSEGGKSVWEYAIFNTCRDGIDADFQGGDVAVYWDVIDLALEELRSKVSQPSTLALEAFGRSPFRYFAKPAPQIKDMAEDAFTSRMQEGTRKLAQAKEDLKHGRISEEEVSRLLEEMMNLNLEPDPDDDAADSEVIDGSGVEFDSWLPMHSMHSPGEVERMIDELTSIESALRTSQVKDVASQYENDLLPELKRIAAAGRMLLIRVDT